MKVRTDNPREVGADRIVNAVAAYESMEALVVVDFGTATTFDCVSVGGDYVGGTIAPGIKSQQTHCSRAQPNSPACRSKNPNERLEPTQLPACKAVCLGLRGARQ